MEFPVIPFVFSIILLFGVGVVLVVGTLRGVKDLVSPSEKWCTYFPYRWLAKAGGRSIYYFHLCVGFAFMTGAALLLVYVFTLS
jgi:hypothetical protein